MTARPAFARRLLGRGVFARPRGEGGYVLTLVLAVTLFLSIMLVALLGLVTTNISTNATSARSAAQRRAADGALGVAVTRLKTTPAADLATGNGCGGLDGSTAELDGRQVTIGCEALPNTDVPVASPGDGAPVLTLLRNYNGVLNDVSGDSNVLIGSVRTWLNGLLANGPGLIHAGSEPMRVAGSVRVGQSTFGGVKPASAGNYHDDAAIRVTGSYRQGDRGFLGGIDLGFIGSTQNCGVLTAPSGDPDSTLRLTSTVGSPECLSGSAADRQTVANISGYEAATPAGYSPVAKPAATTDFPSTCPASAVVSFKKGAYTAAQTAKMNEYFGAGNCDGKTFWFEPGDYYFETQGTARALVFADATSNWVFGTPKGWTPPAAAPPTAFPEACDRSVDGVTITLSPSSTLRHSAGRVAVCGRTNLAVPTIYQSVVTAPQTWLGDPDTADTLTPSPNSFVFSTPANATASVAPAPTFTSPPVGRPFDISETAPAKTATNNQCVNVNTWCAVSLQVKGFRNDASPAQSGPLTSALVKIRGTAQSVIPYSIPAIFSPSDKVYTVATLTFADGRACSVRVTEVARSLTNAKVIDLLAQPNLTNGVLDNSCVGTSPPVLVDASQLETATLRIDESVVVESCGIFCTARATVNIDYVWMEATASVNPPSAFTIRNAPDQGASMNVFGSVVMPRSNVEVRWEGARNAEPLFVGAVVARGLYSLQTPPSNPTAAQPAQHVGVLAARTLLPPGRRVRITATIDGRVRGTAQVLINDTDPTGLMTQPGRSLTVESWKI